ncbi:hypothetical protein [Variovorax sp. YR216]|uniref:hypothetical protein n=1 Tax=Variovorax sp. YR216 TaxID=1882828 RepID=UPI000898B8CA|nr:hypothetical protein [Variovorax sp. YR216]SEB21725.1 hypothetical protein SAMN05444680_11517 [Variovorax sp. YR216]
MFAGHIGVGLALGRAERRVNVGVFIAAALFLDLVLWLFVLLGWESVTLPADFASTHQAEFVFPYSHGLLAAVGWSAVAGSAAFVSYGRPGSSRLRVAGLLATAVFSHWLLDALVHRPELPLAGADSPQVGLGLWHDMPAALLVEAIIVVLGLCLFIPGCRLSRGRRAALTVLSLVVLVFTVVGMTIAPPPPSPRAMAASSCAVLVLVVALACGLAGPSRGAPA